MIGDLFSRYKGTDLFVIIGSSATNGFCRIFGMADEKDKVNRFVKNIVTKYGKSVDFNIIEAKLEDDITSFVMQHLAANIDLNELLMLDNVYGYYKIDNDYNWIDISH